MYTCVRVCGNWIQLVNRLMSTRCEDTIKIKNQKYEVLGQGNEHNFWLGPEFERQADFWAKFVEEADPWPLLFFFFLSTLLATILEFYHAFGTGQIRGEYFNIL